LVGCAAQGLGEGLRDARRLPCFQRLPAIDERAL